MTREKILAMESSELRIEVAEKIFHSKIIGKEGANSPMYLLIGDKGAGWTPLSGERWQSARWSYLEEDAWNDCPEYGSSISAAWEVVEKLTQEYRITLFKFPGGEWSCKFSDYPQVIEPTAQEAICKASLLTVLEEESL